MENRGRVLVVEDAKDIQFVLAKFLRSCGFVVDCADNGLLALEYLRQADELPGLILLDLMMPKMDGWEFRKEQTKDPRLSSIPVVVMTADGGAQAKSIQIGATGHLKKPFADLDLVEQTVARQLLSTRGIFPPLRVE